jgi:hypothetical protein
MSDVKFSTVAVTTFIIHQGVVIAWKPLGIADASQDGCYL